MLEALWENTRDHSGVWWALCAPNDEMKVRSVTRAKKMRVVRKARRVRGLQNSQ